MTDVNVTLRTGTYTLAPMKKIPVGSFGDYINLTIQDSAGVAVNITGMTPKLTLYRPGPLRYFNHKAQFTCTIVSGTAGTCRYLVATGDFNEVVDYIVRVDLYTGTTRIDSTQEFLLAVY